MQTIQLQTSLVNSEKQNSRMMTSKLEVERFVCQLYLQKTDRASLSKSSGGSSLERNKHSPTAFQPTHTALVQAILHAQFNLMVWNKDNIPNSVIPSPSSYGWLIENGEWVPTMTTLVPAPEAIIQLVKCRQARSYMYL